MSTTPEPEMTVEEVAEAIRSGGAIVCFTKCWACQFAELDADHPAEPHTWMDDEDLEHAKLPIPKSPEEWRRLAVKSPCGCWCMKKHREQPTAAKRLAAGDSSNQDPEPAAEET